MLNSLSVSASSQNDVIGMDLGAANGTHARRRPERSGKRWATKDHCDTPAAGSESEGVSGMDAGSQRACGVRRSFCALRTAKQRTWSTHVRSICAWQCDIADIGQRWHVGSAIPRMDSKHPAQHTETIVHGQHLVPRRCDAPFLHERDDPWVGKGGHNKREMRESDFRIEGGETLIENQQTTSRVFLAKIETGHADVRYR